MAAPFVRRWIMLGLVLLCAAAGAAPAPQAGAENIRPFKIRVVDDQTGRGVPLVELRTVANVSYYTDSAGLVAFREPGLMNQPVFFTVRSHGYEFPKDGFGMEGKTLQTAEGGEATLRIKRINIAQRIYRITGEGIYRDSCLLGEKPPLRHPLLNAQVAGQDSVQAAIYKGKIYWLWGDTNRVKYPLGHFATAGATSELPGRGGLPPEVGIDLNYFVDGEGFSKKMCPMPRSEPVLVWLDALVTLPDAAGHERLAARYGVFRNLGTMLEHGLVVFNDKSEIFEKAAMFDLKEPWRFPQGHPVRVKENGEEYFLFPRPYPNVRVKATLKDVQDGAAYEAFTCLETGSRLDAAKVDRDAQGKAAWGWKKNTDPVGPKEEQQLLKAGKMNKEDARFQLRDADTGKPVALHGGTFCWNEYRKRWVLIGVQAGGTSYLGEVWFAEAPAPTGPWTKAKKIVTHEKYSFYNPAQHPFFDEEGGRIIYFEGTYAVTFSGNTNPTPRYDYNQIMYRLDLSDPRLKME